MGKVRVWVRSGNKDSANQPVTSLMARSAMSFQEP